MMNCISLESTIRILCFIKNLEPEFAFKSPVLSMAVIMSVMLVPCLLLLPLFVGVCVWSLFCCAVLSVLYNFAIILFKLVAFELT